MPKPTCPSCARLQLIASIMLLAALCCRLDAENVSIAAASPSVLKNAITPVNFIVTRDTTTVAETFTYTFSGSAAENINFTVQSVPSSGSITLGMGIASGNIAITPINDGKYDGNLQVVCTVLAPGDTLVQAMDSLIITETAPFLSITATTQPLQTPHTAGSVTVSFPAPVQTTDTTVFYVVTGTAMPGVDYSALPGSLVIPMGSSSAAITITPLANSLIETSTTITITLQGAPAYGINGSASAVSTSIANTNCGPLEVGSSSVNGTYEQGTVITLNILFNQAITVTGTPTLALNTGTLTSPGIATYVSTTGETMFFQYLVQVRDATVRLDYMNAAALSLNGGSITGTVSTNPALLTLSNPGSPGSLGANAQINLNGITDGLKPVPGMDPTTDAASSRCGTGAAFAGLLSLAMALGMGFVQRRVPRQD